MGVANHPINWWKFTRRRASVQPTRETKPLTLKEVFEQSDSTPHLFAESADGIRVHRDPAAVKRMSSAMGSADASLFQ